MHICGMRKNKVLLSYKSYDSAPHKQRCKSKGNKPSPRAFPLSKIPPTQPLRWLFHVPLRCIKPSYFRSVSVTICMPALRRLGAWVFLNQSWTLYGKQMRLAVLPGLAAGKHTSTNLLCPYCASDAALWLHSNLAS